MTAPNHVKFQETKKVWRKKLLRYLRKGAFYLSFGSFFLFPEANSRQKQRRKKGEKIEEREAEQEEGGGDRDLCTVRVSLRAPPGLRDTTK